MDIAIIGGGIIGCSAAAYLAHAGASVTLFEQTDVGAGASGRNLGAIQHPFDPVLAPLYDESLDRYRALAADDTEFAIPDRPVGLLLLNRDAAAVRRQADRLALEVPELNATFLDEIAVREAEPSLVGGLTACRLETGYPIPPASATAAFARLARERGAELRIGQAAQPWIDGSRIAGVRLADGSKVTADAVLVAAGPWTPALVDPTGHWQPIHATYGVTVQIRLANPPRHIVEEDEADAVNRPAAATARAAATGTLEPPSLFSLASANGISTLGSTFLPAGPDPVLITSLLLRRGISFLPALAEAEVIGGRVCARPQSFDGRPFIGPVPGVEGLFVCAGHGPWGISTGPASAALVAALILDPTHPLPPELSVSSARG